MLESMSVLANILVIRVMALTHSTSSCQKKKILHRGKGRRIPTPEAKDTYP